ncbi:Butirosin biosynthesis, BtrG-like protein [Tribonema minus]|uniref:Putative gamma-glutamylcyclotransferase n=1 Tax=Tribonema minus TaxID=303371 RepID=A0A836CNX4_9STRA|nr:Butirosin biosynthesis, BtrG-like protein [Tribonema minus]
MAPSQDAKPKATVFVYGTLMESRVVTTLLGHMPSSEKAVLPGFHRYRIKDRVYPAIRPKEDGSVSGIVFDVTEREERIFDLFEDSDYDKETVTVTLEDGSAVTCSAYVWNLSAAEELYGAWDFDAHFAPHVDSYAVMCRDFIDDVLLRGLAPPAEPPAAWASPQDLEPSAEGYAGGAKRFSPAP